MVEKKQTNSLRARLREETGPLHDSLDIRMGQLDLAVPEDYARFLKLQLAARAPIERWARHNCPAHLRPPAQVPLLLEDLSELGGPFSVSNRAFALPVHAEPLGFAWVMAGSHLGNRVMLNDLRKRANGRLPTRFLSDPRMMEFWRDLRPQLEQPASDEQTDRALTAALTTFRFFLSQFPGESERVAGRRVA
ncbi:hypothetical protein D6851_10790 [Altericroceibacterium spongiae]|uniref:Heme oxygenase n=1 Tax=Altericroceibacterium spongiae TaxID=2320269 RepID=A0A420EIT5_9SPHN|nr:biliverdin-producing heme oxygenase [Altericroceibacterium spongiae]RKF20615.1 hypothetical protein D6851_10790 [Altericroceibacterium spongiae]